jgi:hypothetical protein
MLAAGFTHNDHEAGAQGFAAGGPLDQMEPGPALARFASDAWDGGLAVLSDDELIGVLCAARRLASWASALELTAVARLGSRRAADARAAGDKRGAEHVGDEVAAALTLTCRAADRLVSLAAGVTRLPAAAAALAAGRIDMPRAIIFTDELAGLDDVAAAAVAALVAADAPVLTTGQLRGVLHRAVLALDPDAARKRREKAQKNARVECWTEPAGTWSLAGRDLPPVEVLAADKHVDGLARDLKNAGADGTLEQLRSQVFLALLSGQPLYTLLPGQDDGAGAHPGDDGDDPGNGPVGGGGGSRRPDHGPFTGPGGTEVQPGSAGLTGTVNFTVPLITWLGLTGLPGEAAGYGHLDAAASRDLVAAITAHQHSRWCLTITGPDGRAIGHGCARKGQPPPGGPAPPGSSPPGRPAPGRPAPGRPAPGGDAPPSHRPGPAPPGPGTPGSSGPAPPGQYFAPPGTGSVPWLAGVTINWLETGACGHARETFAYQPSPALRHLLKTRDQTCSFPGCRRPARRCDDDHTIPYDQGGRTCECNCAALCRRHHRAKQAPRWRLRQPRPGTLTWTLPSGRTYTTKPRPYAVET